jgi:AraC-like DNA-binding protein
MEHAADMLRGRHRKVRDVARRVGYRQPAHFAKAFRRHHGTSPSAFRAHRPPVAREPLRGDRLSGCG